MNDSSETFTGTLTNINAALNGMTFLPASNFAGSGGINVIIDDLGNTGAGGARTSWASVAVTIANATPTVAKAAAASPSQVNGTTTALSALGADDGGATNLTYSWATTGTVPAPVVFSDNGDNSAQDTTATFAAAGTYNFQVTISDVQGASVTSAVQVTVNQVFTSTTLTPASAALAPAASASSPPLPLTSSAQPWSISPASTGRRARQGISAARALHGTGLRRSRNGYRYLGTNFSGGGGGR